jgi:hypothetical protein
MSISTYFRPNIHQDGPKILGINSPMKTQSLTVVETSMQQQKGQGESAHTPIFIVKMQILEKNHFRNLAPNSISEL